MTLLVNVPVNEALALVEVTESIEAARAIWQDYSPRWQVFNILRTIASGVALALCGVAIFLMRTRV